MRQPKNVKVERFRYIDFIKTNKGDILQMSSQISGILEKNYEKRIGTLIFQMLPAGSICGAPKKRIIDIIEHTEKL